MIHWGEPPLLLGLGLLPLAAWLLVRAARGRVAAALRFADATMLPRLAPAPSRWRSWAKGAGTLAGLGCMVLAAARPRSGAVSEESVFRAADVAVVLDVSQSMMAEDVAPNRLGAAKAVLRSLLDQVRGDRVGLWVFAGKPVLKAPLTADHGFLREVLEDIDPQSAPRGGTRLGDAVRKALESLPDRGDRSQVIVLLSDGEDHDGTAEAAAREAARRGVRIFTVALGDARTGARVPVIDPSGRRGYLRYEGQEVWSKANEGLLAKIAAQTGGASVSAATGGRHLGPSWKELLAPLERREVRQERRIALAERFQWPLAAGVLLLWAESLLCRYPRRGKRTQKESTG